MMAAISTAVVLATIAGVAAIFVAQPLQRFYELREVCRSRCLILQTSGSRILVQMKP
jgi:hypothetical protein